LSDPLSAPEVAHDQRIRLVRFRMALATYGVVVLAALLLSRLGLGRMSGPEWAWFVGSAIAINSLFFLVLRSGANLRLGDPSLTGAQILASALWGTIALWSLPQARPIILMFYLPAFSFGMLRFDRRRFLGVVAGILAIYAGLLGLEYAVGRTGFRPGYELFLFAIFGLVLCWFAFFGGYVFDLRRRFVERSSELQRVNAELRESLAHVKTLTGLIPICSSCKKIRDDDGYWNQIETYIATRSDAEFTHGICPECAEALLRGLPGGESSA
jgi:hypothetical protein